MSCLTVTCLAESCFYSTFARLLLVFEVLILDAAPSLCGSSVRRNPQSDFDRGVVLLMHVCFYRPGGQEKI